MENLPSSHGKKIQGRKMSESEVRENISAPRFFCLSNSATMITAAPSLIPSQRSCGMENLPSSHGKKIQDRKISESEVRENISAPRFFLPFKFCGHDDGSTIPHSISKELRHGEPSQQSWQKDSGQKNFRVRGSGKYFCPSFFCLSNSAAMITAAPSLIPSPS